MVPADLTAEDGTVASRHASMAKSVGFEQPVTMQLDPHRRDAHGVLSSDLPDRPLLGYGSEQRVRRRTGTSSAKIPISASHTAAVECVAVMRRPTPRKLPFNSRADCSSPDDGRVLGRPWRTAQECSSARFRPEGRRLSRCSLTPSSSATVVLEPRSTASRSQVPSTSCGRLALWPQARSAARGHGDPSLHRPCASYA